MNHAQIEAFTPLTQAARRLFHMLGHAATTLHWDIKISAGMRAVLESVIQGGPQTVPQMARIRPVSRQHIQGLVNELLAGGWVAYADNPAHKRSKLVVPTPHGEQVFKAMRARENAAFRRITLDCTADELVAADKVLKQLIEIFGGPEWHSIVAENANEMEK